MMVFSSLYTQAHTHKHTRTQMDKHTMHVMNKKTFEKTLKRLTDGTPIKTLTFSMNLQKHDRVNRLAAALAVNQTLTALNMNETMVGNGRDVNTIVHSLRANTTIRVLYFGGQFIGANDEMKAMETLTSWLVKGSPLLTVLNLVDNDLHDDGAKHVGQYLKTNDTLITLYLTDNKIGPEGTAALAQGLLHHSCLTTLYLNHNPIQDKGATSIAQVLECTTTLAHLNLEKTGIEKEGAKALASSLRVNSSLTALDLDHNNIQEEGTLALVSILKDDLRFLSKVARDDEAAASTAALAWYEAASATSPMTEAKVDALAAKAVFLLAKQNQRNATLLYLRIWSSKPTCFSKEESLRILNYISRNYTLLHLNIREIHHPDFCDSYVYNHTKKNRSLQKKRHERWMQILLLIGRERAKNDRAALFYVSSTLCTLPLDLLLYVVRFFHVADFGVEQENLVSFTKDILSMSKHCSIVQLGRLCFASHTRISVEKITMDEC